MTDLKFALASQLTTANLNEEALAQITWHLPWTADFLPALEGALPILSRHFSAKDIANKLVPLFADPQSASSLSRILVSFTKRRTDIVWANHVPRISQELFDTLVVEVLAPEKWPQENRSLILLAPLLSRHVTTAPTSTDIPDPVFAALSTLQLHTRRSLKFLALADTLWPTSARLGALIATHFPEALDPQSDKDEPWYPTAELLHHHIQVDPEENATTVAFWYFEHFPPTAPTHRSILFQSSWTSEYPTILHGLACTYAHLSPTLQRRTITLLSHWLSREGSTGHTMALSAILAPRTPPALQQDIIEYLAQNHITRLQDAPSDVIPWFERLLKESSPQILETYLELLTPYASSRAIFWPTVTLALSTRPATSKTLAYCLSKAPQEYRARLIGIIPKREAPESATLPPVY